MTKKILLQFGCGPNVVQSDWIDYDGSVNARINKMPRMLTRIIRKTVSLATSKKIYEFPEHVKYLRLTSPLRLSSDSADAIFASHVWEHLYYEDAKALTLECFRVLKPGGVIRLIVPDLKTIVESYLKVKENAALEMNEKLLFCSRNGGGVARRFTVTVLGDLHTHKFMYDYEALSNLLLSAGFTGVKQARYLQSDIPEISQVEQQGRVENGAGVVVEGKKPIR